MGRLETQKSNQIGLRAMLGVVAAVVVLGIALSPRALLHSRQPIVPLHFKIDHEIAQDIHIGSDKSQVMEYCKRRGWECHDQGRTVMSVDRDAPKNNFIRTDVAVTFEFDATDKLLSYHSEDHYTGP